MDRIAALDSGMTANRRPLDAETWSGLHQQISGLLPVRDSRSLLRDLAACWCTLTGSEAVLVASEIPDSEQNWGSFAVAGEPGRVYRWDAAAADTPQPVDLLAALERQSGTTVDPQWKWDTELLGDGQHRVGTVLLFHSPESPPNRALYGHLREIGGQLVAQALLVEGNDRRVSGPASFEAAKLDSLAEFAAGAGHEINNPLATISGRVQLLLKDETDPVRREALATIGGQAYRVRDMIGDVMLFARPPKPEPTALNLAEVIAGVLARLVERADRQGCLLTQQTDELVPIWADRGQLQIVICSLVENSLDQLPTGGPIVITAKPIVDDENSLALMTVCDQGPGLTDSDREHLFDPFYSGRQAGRGLGFGLSKCWRIVSNHRGWIDVDCTPSDGTIFRVYWPAERPQNDDVVC
jgi:signal transduction histidine kinase